MGGGLRGDTGGAGAVHAVTVGDMEVQFRDSGSRRRPEVSGGGRRPASRMRSTTSRIAQRETG